MKKILFCFSLLAFMLVACTPTYMVVFTAGEGGSVSSPGGEYDEGTVISVTANPAAEYEFVSWSDGSTQNPRNITVSETTNLTATFTKKQYDLNISVVGEGSVLEQVVVQGGKYNSGSQVKLTATPAEGWEFDSWAGDFSENTNPLVVEVNGTKNVTATFKRKFYTITIDTDHSELYSLRLIKGQIDEFNETKYEFNSVIEVSFIDGYGKVYKAVTGDIETSLRKFEFEVLGDVVITPEFVKAYWITLQGQFKFFENKDTLSPKKEGVVEGFYKPSLGYSGSSDIAIIDDITGKTIWTGNWNNSINPRVLLSPGKYRITQPFRDGNKFNNVDVFRYGYALPTYIEETFIVEDDNEFEKIVKMDVKIPPFVLFSFDTSKFDGYNQCWSWLGFEVRNEYLDYITGISFVPNCLPIVEPYYLYIGLSETVNTDLFKITLSRAEFDDEGNIVNTLSTRYHNVESEIFPGAFIHFEIRGDSFGWPVVSSEIANPNVDLSSPIEVEEKYEFGFITLEAFDVFDNGLGLGIFPNEVIGDPVDPWNYRDLLPESVDILMTYGNYELRMPNVSVPSPELTLAFVPYFPHYGGIKFLFSSSINNGFGWGLGPTLERFNRNETFDFNGLAGLNINQFILSVPDEGFDKVEMYIVYEDEPSFPFNVQDWFRTNEGFLAVKKDDMAYYNGFYYRFFDKYTSVLPPNYDLYFKGIILKAIKNGEVVYEKRFMDSEYNFQNNFHYNYSITN